eukprot:m51a1_g13545 putative papain family cysteine protease domain containing protein (139) ;mRNA; f:982-1764
MHERTGLINGGEGRGPRSPGTLALWAVVALLVGACTVGVFVYGADLHRKANKILEGQERAEEGAPLPKSFLIPDRAMTPVKDQMSRGTCWIFSTMGLIESSYRKNGIEKGFLRDDEYVSFSEQASTGSPSGSTTWAPR